MLEGDLDTALKLFREIAGLYQQLNQPLWLGACYDEQARIHSERGEFDLAAALFEQEQAIYVRHGNLSLLRWSLGNEAEMLLSRGDIPGALVRLEHAEQLCREMQTPDQLAQTLDRQAHHRTDINELDKAMEQLLEAESIYRSTLQNDMLLASNLLSQATILEKQERYEASLQRLEEAEPLCRRSGNKQLLLMNLWSQSSLLALSIPQQIPAAELYSRMLQVTKEAGELAQKLAFDEIATSLLGQADKLSALLKSL